ncbi:MAG: DinB family protein [Chloroflexi bacterium]|nr:DinB family protein [Chloroflexota bacterium]
MSDPTLIDSMLRWHLPLMSRTLETLGHILARVSQQQATTLRDGADGWTVLEVVCHLRDYDRIFQDRASSMLEQDNPLFQSYNPDQLARERNYNASELHAVYAELCVSRTRYVEFFQSLSPEQWQRHGTHPKLGAFSLADALMQVTGHDLIHMEQITRILLQAE